MKDNKANSNVIIINKSNPNKTQNNIADNNNNSIENTTNTAKKELMNIGMQTKIFAVLIMLFSIFLFIALITHTSKDEPNLQIKISELFGLFSNDPIIKMKFDTTINSVGLIGAVISNLLINEFIGIWAIGIPIMLFVWGLRAFKGGEVEDIVIKYSYIHIIIAFIISCLFGSLSCFEVFLDMPLYLYGVVGALFGTIISNVISPIGSTILFLGLFVLTLIKLLQIKLLIKKIKDKVNSINLKGLSTWLYRFFTEKDTTNKKAEEYDIIIDNVASPVIASDSVAINNDINGLPRTSDEVLAMTDNPKPNIFNDQYTTNDIQPIGVIKMPATNLTTPLANASTPPQAGNFGDEAVPLLWRGGNYEVIDGVVNGLPRKTDGFARNDEDNYNKADSGQLPAVYNHNNPNATIIDEAVFTFNPPTDINLPKQTIIPPKYNDLTTPLANASIPPQAGNFGDEAVPLPWRGGNYEVIDGVVNGLPHKTDGFARNDEDNHTRHAEFSSASPVFNEEIPKQVRYDNNEGLVDGYEAFNKTTPPFANATATPPQAGNFGDEAVPLPWRGGNVHQNIDGVVINNDNEEIIFTKPNEPIKIDLGKPKLTIEVDKEARPENISNYKSFKNPLSVGVLDEKIDYTPPKFDLLDPATNEYFADDEELQRNGRILQEKLETFKISISNLEVTRGPVVTQYEFIPADGVKINKIEGLADDLAMALKARSVHIIAPVPEKGTVGIQIPNSNPSIVRFRSVIATQEFAHSKFELPLALGKTVSGDPFVADLAKMPHLLVAGSTGSGKSVGINTIISSLLYKKHPSQLKFIIIDPKKVELTPYVRLSNHFLAISPDLNTEIVTEPQDAISVLKSAVLEMEKRYTLLEIAKQRNIKDYNEKVRAGAFKNDVTIDHRELPYLVVIVDELADLMLTAGKEIELPIVRLAQMARAVGIHLIIATQRPSVNIITGIIKANFPSRIAYLVASKVDSRTILDASGAEALLGNGDMLFSAANQIKAIRIQNPFISTDEVERLCDFIGNQIGYSEPYILPSTYESGSEGGSYDASNFDPLFREAAELIIEQQMASTSMLQRRLKIGFARAGRIIDELASAKVIGPPQGSKPRSVLMESMSELEKVFM